MNVPRVNGTLERGIRRVTHHMALRWRLMLMLAVLIVASFGLMGMISVRIYTDSIIGQTIERKNELGASTLEAVGIIRIRDEYSAQQVMRNDNVMGALSYSGPQTPYLHFLEVWNCSKALMELSDKSNIVGLAALGYNGKSFFSKSETDTTNLTALQSVIAAAGIELAPEQDGAAGSAKAAVDEDDGESVWVTSPRNIFNGTGGDSLPSLYAVTRLFYDRNKQTERYVGVAVMQVEYKRLHDILSRTTAGQDEFAMIADGNGTVLCSTAGQSGVGAPLPEDIVRGAASGLHGSFTLKGQNGSVLYLYNRDPASGWVLLQAVPYANIASAADDVRRWMIPVIAGCLIGALAVAWVYAKTISNPVVRLEKVMARFGGGELSARSPADRSDEIGSLQQSFNAMAGQINTLLTDMEVEHRQKRKLEIRMLEYQINPHFLYNSLDTINWMASSAGNREIAEMATALARFFRLGLSRGRETVSLEDEVEHARNYLLISKIRYHDGFAFDVSVDREARDCKVVKLILQPLAENTLVHAIKKSGAGGHVSIRADLQGERVVIEVEDNGRGIPPERLLELRRMLANRQNAENADGGIGLTNVQQRIQLYYGSEYGLEIESQEGRGTTVRAVLPVVR